jgi:hypothetical protein
MEERQAAVLEWNGGAIGAGGGNYTATLSAKKLKVVF